MKVSITGDDLGMILWNFFDIIGPPSSGFDGGLNRLRTRVHHQNFVFAAKFREILGEERELLRVKRSGCQGELIDLGMGNLGDPIVTMSEVKRAVGA
jgi:hypothetical protein